MRTVITCIALWLSLTSVNSMAQPIDFEAEVRPLLLARCVECHGPNKQEGGLRLDAKSLAFQGGDSGAVIAPQKSADSELIRRVSSGDANEFMPPQGERLTEQQIALLRRWIDAGADWPETEADRTAMQDPRLNHWAWQPLKRPEIPAVGGTAKVRNDVDRFLLAKLEEQKITPNAEADRRTLIRRLSFDLLGLPPTIDEIEAFAADDDPRAYERLVDRLLASPRYGERWARHWLDVVHYGDTHGYDKDQPRPYAWPYRDYVIRAFNEDKPYSRFIEEQIAGDVLYPDSRDGYEALGFIAAGPWDLIGHAEVPETKIDGKIARHLDRDDMVANTIGTFCSATVHCAQCHNHKFDPITQADYYSLQAVFAAVDRADRPYFADGSLTRRYRELDQARRRLTERQQTVDARLRQLGGAELAHLDQQVAAAAQNAKGNTSAEFGYHSALSDKQDLTKWVQVDLGASVAIDKIVLIPCFDDFNNIGAGFGFPLRYKIEIGGDPEFNGLPHVAAARDVEDVPNPGTAPQTFPAKGAQGRFVRVTAIKLAPRQNDYILALAELQVMDAEGKNLAAGAAVTALDSIEAAPRWRKSNLVDGIAPLPDNNHSLAELRAAREKLLERLADEPTKREQAEILAEKSAVDAELKTFPSPSMVYAGTIHDGGGAAFRGTGPDGGRPRPIHILARGNVQQPGRLAEPGTIAALSMLPGRFDLPADHTEGDRRAALARWISDEKNPLTWRSIVNRVWQYHFRRGLVETANDFGRMGTPPTHPELLDWLACEFRDSGGSLKQLHKLLVTSAAYRQSSEVGPAAPLATDGDNRWLWRQNRRKLEAEAVRDAVLATSGKLDLTMGGAGYQDFVVEHPAHSPHYVYGLADPRDPKSWRRSVYRFIVRSQTQPFMTSLDCADPSMRVEKRNESVSALQALALLNNGFMVAQSSYFADRVRQQAGDDMDRQVETAYRLALGRSPTAEERGPVAAFVREQGLPNLCRVLVNLNEFVFVD